MNAIEFQNVSKSFARHTGHLLLRQRFMQLLGTAQAERFHALKNVSLRVRKGESLAVVGRNGAGKSTMLGILAGLVAPDTGQVEVNGRVAALLDLGTGFHPDLTGRENVALNASLLGLTRTELADVFDEIVAFSGIEEFIEEPLRTYSTGMVLRLAFSVAINTSPDILIIDEVLAVGDQAFQAKCIDQIHQFRRSGKSIIAVSHAHSMVEDLCDHAVWLDHGEVLMQGDIREVIGAYSGRQGAARGT